MNDAGATQPRPRKTSTPTRNVIVDPDALSSAFASCPLAAATLAAGAATGLAGAAESFGAGGGHVIFPSLTTVAPRTTSSSKLTTNTPSFAGHMSVSRWRKLVA